jgi:diadenylate cyclase
MNSLLLELQNQFRFADAIDIGVVSILLYITLIWFRDRASRSLVVVIVSLVTLFVLARWLELYLTTQIFQLGFLGIVLVIVVVFQQDIRHGFERLASSPWFFRSTSPPPDLKGLDTIAAAIECLAQQRIGALLVFPGVEPLDRHVRGGVQVDAEISLPLLLSIFNPQTPGHDGAVLIADNRISQLALHLPLSSNLPLLRDGGTRHAAALGLSECCDSLVVAVSEERGTISLAQAGKLEAIGPTEVQKRIQRHFAQHSPATGKPIKPWFRNLSTKLLSLAFAILIWFLFAYHTETIQRTIVIPIEYRNLPDGWVIAEPKATHVEVTLAGSEQAFNLLDVAKARVSLEITDAGEDNLERLETEPNLQNVPRELKVNQIIPKTVTVAVRKGSQAQP